MKDRKSPEKSTAKFTTKSCRIHACGEKRRRKIHSAGRGARQLLLIARSAGQQLGALSQLALSHLFLEVAPLQSKTVMCCKTKQPIGAGYGCVPKLPDIIKRASFFNSKPNSTSVPSLLLHTCCKLSGPMRDTPHVTQPFSS